MSQKELDNLLGQKIFDWLNEKKYHEDDISVYPCENWNKHSPEFPMFDVITPKYWFIIVSNSMIIRANYLTPEIVEQFHDKEKLKSIVSIQDEVDYEFWGNSNGRKTIFARGPYFSTILEYHEGDKNAEKN